MTEQYEDEADVHAPCDAERRVEIGEEMRIGAGGQPAVVVLNPRSTIGKNEPSNDGESEACHLREVGRDLWSWLTDGAHVYVCGDAKRMAKDVERALVDIVAQHGARSTDQAIAFVAELKKQGRYQQDVY